MSREARMDQDWPNLFVVGAPRAGTTSLWSYLGQHPEIYMAKVKEPHYFSLLPQSIVRPVRDEADYLRLFRRSRSARYCGEASPSYLWDSEAAGAIARVTPQARIVISLREPLARARSAYWHSVRYGAEGRPFAEAIEDSLAQMDRGLPPRYLRQSLYADSVEGFLLAFPGNVHVLFFEELAAHTRLEVRRLYEFLAVDPAFADRVDLEIRNQTGVPRNVIVRRLYRWRAVRELGSALVPPRLQTGLHGALLAPPQVVPLEPALHSRLLELYEPDRRRLEELLGRPVPWKSG